MHLHPHLEIVLEIVLEIEIVLVLVLRGRRAPHGGGREADAMRWPARRHGRAQAGAPTPSGLRCAPRVSAHLVRVGVRFRGRDRGRGRARARARARGRARARARARVRVSARLSP
jgi:hypothetical protein